MAPPTSKRSTRGRRLWITSILPEILAPPSTATNGRRRGLQGAAEVVQLLLHQQAGHARREEAGHALGGGMGAMGGAEGVVDKEVAQRAPAAARRPDRSFSSSAWKRRFSRRSTRRRAARGRPPPPRDRRSRRRSHRRAREAPPAARPPAAGIAPDPAFPWAGPGATSESPCAPASVQKAHRRQGGLDPRVVGNAPVLERHIEVDPGERPFPRQRHLPHRHPVQARPLSRARGARPVLAATRGS